MDTQCSLRKAFKKYWGYTDFRPFQLEACLEIMSARDVCVVMATGSGKSLLYQLPPVAISETGIKALSIVVCPLISLMEDQISFLKEMGVSAGMIGGSANDSTESKALAGEFTILYSTPEKLLNWRYGLTSLMKVCKILCIAIDESHCVSEWGHEFRPMYRQLGILRDWCPDIPLVALTATATSAVTNDIISNLRLRNPFVVKSSFDRPNLRYSVRNRNGPSDLINLLYLERRHLISIGGNTSRYRTIFPCTLVYVSRKNEAEEIAEVLGQSSSLGDTKPTVACYHAGMSASQRSKVHQAFLNDEIQIVVATVAFGMGEPVSHCIFPIECPLLLYLFPRRYSQTRYSACRELRYAYFTGSVLPTIRTSWKRWSTCAMHLALSP